VSHERAGCHVFTYGTLVFPEVMEAVAGRAFVSLAARLAGYGRVCVRGAVYPGARADATATIDGVLYLDVGRDALERLDRFEGELYERCPVRVLLEDRSTCAAQVYVVPAAMEDRLERTPWDLEGFRRDHLASYLARCRAGRVAEEHEG
jgi:gamma-glutamylcyclotransferase (GGCT)/AIG2-like uncharacterized protein YtfP